MENSAVVDCVRAQTVGDISRRSAARYPDKVALIEGDKRITFAEFDAMVDRTASALAASGLAHGDRLALLSHNSWQFAVLSFAAARAGVILTPLNFMLGAPEIGFILEHSEAKGLVVEDALVETAEEALRSSGNAVSIRGVINMNGLDVGHEWTDVDEWFKFAGPMVSTRLDDDEPLRLMYTSGTESKPKGVLLSSRSLMWQYATCVIDGKMETHDVELHTLPLYHCAQLDCFLGPDFYVGATSIILRGPEPSEILRNIEMHKVTKFFAPPTVWISLLRHPDFERFDLSSLTKGYYGASPMPVEVLTEIQQRLPAVRLWNFYGQTEMSPVATILDPEEQVEGAGSAGRPALNVETKIVSAEGGSVEPLPVGAVGEIVHRSPHAMLGYFRDAPKTEEAFVGGWFHSGDLGYFDEKGRLFVVDRKKDMIKTGGENVSAREVEEVIYQLDEVAEVAVFGVPHPRWVEAVAAVVVPKPDVRIEPERVMEHARAALAGFKAPKYVVVSDSLPKNPSGKILKRELRETHVGLANR